MNRILDQFYYDTITHYLNASYDYQQARVAFQSSKGGTWTQISDAAELLAEYRGYLSFLLGLHLGMAMEEELFSFLAPEL